MRLFKKLVLGMLLSLVLSLSSEAAEFTELCRTGTVQQIRQALQRGADANARDGKGEIPLIAALDNKSSARVLQLLKENKADVNARNTAGFTPLHAAVFKYDGEVVVELLRLGADVNAATEEFGTALFLALLRSPIDPKIVNLLIQTGSDVNFIDQEGMTPLLQAIIAQAPVEIVEMLLENGAKVDLTSPKIDDETPLMVAAGSSSASVVKLLLDAEASISLKSASGKTPADYAREAGKTENQNLLTTAELSSSVSSSNVSEDLAEAASSASADVPVPIQEEFETETEPLSESSATIPTLSPPSGNVRSPSAGISPEAMFVLAFLRPVFAFLERMSGLSIFLHLFVFHLLGSCFGFWAGSLVMLRAPIRGKEIALCSVLYAGMSAWGTQKIIGAMILIFGQLLNSSGSGMSTDGIVSAFAWFLGLFLLSLIVPVVLLKMFIPHPKGGRIGLGKAVFTVLSAFLYSTSFSGVCFAVYLSLRLGTYMLGLKAVAFFAVPFLSFYLAGLVVIKSPPSAAELLTCVQYFGLIVGILHQVEMIEKSFILSLLVFFCGAVWSARASLFEPADGSRLNAVKAAATGGLACIILAGAAMALRFVG